MILSGFNQLRLRKKEEIKESVKWIQLCISIFLCLQLTPGNEPMEAWRFCSSFLLFYFCVCGRFVYNFQRGFSQSWGIGIEKGAEENKKGGYFCTLKTGGSPPGKKAKAALFLFFFLKRLIGWMVLVSSNTGFIEFLPVLPRGIMVWKIVSIKSNSVGGGYSVYPLSPCFLKGLKKEPFVIFSRKVTLKFIRVVFMGFICVIHRQL